MGDSWACTKIKPKSASMDPSHMYLTPEIHTFCPPDLGTLLLPTTCQLYDLSLFVMLLFQIDNVGLHSWQAQVTGTKVWTLEPPPECYYECVSGFKITVKPGEISKILKKSFFLTHSPEVLCH